tara:strand:+ start:577 stop:894 length:318 start_codon:yes stop_codon:yes gene_type:complete
LSHAPHINRGNLAIEGHDGKGRLCARLARSRRQCRAAAPSVKLRQVISRVRTKSHAVQELCKPGVSGLAHDLGQLHRSLWFRKRLRFERPSRAIHWLELEEIAAE